MDIRVRLATPEDVPVLGAVIEASVRGLQAQDYTARQIELALKTVYGVDTQLITDGMYFAAEAAVGSAEVETRAGEDEKGWKTATGGSGANRSSVIVGCGGWSKRKTLFGGDQWSGRQDDLLDPVRDAAKIRAFFVRPGWARRGIGTMILDACETAAKAAGFGRLEMGATLSGVPFYAAKGYAALENVEVPLGNGESLGIVRMAKAI
jgi:GNAT superfamily N-acetyltransferase